MTYRDAKKVWESDNSMYGRGILVKRVDSECSVCKRETTTLDIDTSDGEYLSFLCCLPCFTKLLSGDEQ
jgi:hypothetical protein